MALYKLRLVLPFGVTLVTKSAFENVQQAMTASAALPFGFEVISDTDVDPGAILIPLKEKKLGVK